MYNKTQMAQFENLSAFDPGIWDQDEWKTLINYSPSVKETHTTQLSTYGYSFIKDSYFCLRDNTPKTDTLLGLIWEQVQGANSFATLPPFLTDINKTVTTVVWLADKVEQAFRDLVRSDHDDLDKPIDPNSPPVVPDASDLNLTDKRDLDGMLAVDACLWALFDGTPKDKRALADQTKHLFDLKNITRFLGWAKSTVGGAARVGKAVAGQLTGYKGGGWSSNVHPSEMLNLVKGNPITRINMVENKLNTRQYTTTTPQGRGGVILLRDHSGSMNIIDHPNDCTRLQTAVSIEAALALAFNGENRDLISIIWSSRVCDKYVYGEPGWKEHITKKPHSYDSTLIDKALAMAVATAADYAPNSDICIATDGMLDNHASQNSFKRFDDMLAPFRARGGKVWAIILADNNTMSQIKEVWGWVDGYITTESFNDVDAMTSIVANMATPRNQDNVKRLI